MMNDPALNLVVRDIQAVLNDPATPEPVIGWLNGLLVKLEDVGAPDPRFVKGGEIPASLGDLADEYAVVREKRLAEEKIAKATKERETELFNSALATLDESADTGAMGKEYAVQRVEKDVNNVTDWPALWKHIQQTGSFELLGKSINQKAVREQIEAGEAIPGIEQNKVATLSFTKVKK